jgi:hypothetical protein
MADKSVEERIAALEAKMGSKSLDTRFREQAELIDQLFLYRFEENDRRWDAKLDARFADFEERLDAKFDAKLEAKFESKLAPIYADLAAIKDAVRIILTRLR